MTDNRTLIKDMMTKPKKEKYTFRRKVIYKGKMAPRGCVYLVIKVQSNGYKVEACKLITGGQSAELELGVCETMYKQVMQKYKSALS
jgi:hypothetical protein